MFSYLTPLLLNIMVNKLKKKLKKLSIIFAQIKKGPKAL